ncbi:MAG: ABC transporter permease subunit [Planctomycetota bacterium]|nr:ABC transporter permease subunit [Planctomycetota bacterium]
MNIGPFNVGLVRRALREVFWSTVVLALISGAISGLLAYALPRVQARFMSRGRIPPGVRQFRDAMFGFDSTSSSVSDIAFSLAWSHPIVIALLAAHAIIVCTRVLAGEVERGTVDVLLALPVSRMRLFASETLAWSMSGAVLLGAVYAGSWTGARFIEEQYRPDFGRLFMVLCNLALVYGVIGMVAMFGAIVSDRRVRAVLATIILTVFSVLINFLYTLDPSLEFTKHLRFLSVLDYYRPIRMLMEAAWPWRDMGILAGTIGVLWVGALVVLSRRDITTT